MIVGNSVYNWTKCNLNLYPDVVKVFLGLVYNRTKCNLNVSPKNFSFVAKMIVIVAY